MDNASLKDIVEDFKDIENHPYSKVTWKLFDAEIKGENSDNIFFQKDVEFPDFWSQNAVNIVSSKYFRGKMNAPEREWSLRHLIDRVVGWIAEKGKSEKYFFTRDEVKYFRYKLINLILFQKFSFNSPVWFNIGTDRRPIASACYILGLDDSMESIAEWIRDEIFIFRGGSGSGVNVSSLRPSGAPLSNGGYASGPLSFMRSADYSAGAIKSGGATRRSAKMVLMDADHPEIMSFIEAKSKEEKKALALIKAGFDSSIDGDVYKTVAFQNANHSVRVSDDFMNNPTEENKAVLSAIATATWECGDPGMQFHDTINKWHTCKNDGKINASNPCSEYVFLDDTACTLGSLNLMGFVNPDNAEFNIQEFMDAVDIATISLDILVGNSEHYVDRIERKNKLYRTIGLGYANLGALCMLLGYPYGSKDAQDLTTAITSLMTSQAYFRSNILAEEIAPFERYEHNKNCMKDVIYNHRLSAYNYIHGIRGEYIRNIMEQSIDRWESIIESNVGFRNAQVTLLAPTGTIGFMMDCDTFGIEPELSLVKYKKLVGGGTMKIVNKNLRKSLETLLSDGDVDDKHDSFIGSNKINEILKYVEYNGTIEGAPYLSEKQQEIFLCSFSPFDKGKTISWKSHIDMMAAAQPFLSGAISKTVNLPNEATVEDVKNAYVYAHEKGLKSIAIYRDGCKSTQPLNTSNDSKANKDEKTFTTSTRRRMPKTRQSITHKFSIDNNDGYITIGFYETGEIGELFIRMAKEGTTIAGLLDAFATAVSIGLQSGVSMETLIEKFSYSRFLPSGFTDNKEIPIAHSILDYIFRWIKNQYYNTNQIVGIPIENEKVNISYDINSPNCPNCHSSMVRIGSCYYCGECGESSGCS